jgi:hypothetical protein
MFEQHEEVVYIPAHATGCSKHPDMERGRVHKVTDKFVFVKFYKSGELLCDVEAKACKPEQLKILKNKETS